MAIVTTVDGALQNRMPSTIKMRRTTGSGFASAILMSVVCIWMLGAWAAEPQVRSYSFTRFHDEIVSPSTRSNRDHRVCLELPKMLNEEGVGPLACLTELPEMKGFTNLEWMRLDREESLRLEGVRKGRSGKRASCGIAATDVAPHPRTAELIAQGAIAFEKVESDFDRDGDSEAWLRRIRKHDPCGLTGVHLYYVCQEASAEVTDLVAIYGRNAFKFNGEAYTYSWSKLPSDAGFVSLFHLNPSSDFNVAQICRIDYR